MLQQTIFIENPREMERFTYFTPSVQERLAISSKRDTLFG